MTDILEIKGSELRFTDSAREDLDRLVKSTGEASGPDAMELHRLMGAKLYGPISKLAHYQEWARFFFMQETGTINDQIRIVQDTYAAVVYETSPDGQFLFNRPGYTYATVEWQTVDAGMEISWRQMRMSGFNLLQTKMQEVAEEFARKFDAMRQNAMDVSCAATTGHFPTVSTTVTKASVDSILKLARQAGFDIGVAAANSGTLMDMSSWTIAANSMWQAGFIDKGPELFTNLWVSNYGGVNWFASKDVPSNYIYFSAGADKTGWEWTGQAPITMSDVDVVHKVDQHVWEIDKAFRVENAYALYRLQIT